MNSLLIFGLIASVYAAPHFPDFGHHHHYHKHHHGSPRYLSQYHHHSQLANDDDFFDTNKFWSDFYKEMKDFDNMMAEFSRQFPTSVSQEGVEGNEYRIMIPLNGFEEKDIVVKAREGFLMIQAHRSPSEGSEMNYLDVRNLPNTININGTWNYAKGILRIVFPLKEAVETEAVDSATHVYFTTRTSTSTTATPDREDLDKEQVEETVSNQDADVGLKRGDVETEVKTNEIEDDNVVEATTYAVDLKDEVEFVPVRY